MKKKLLSLVLAGAMVASTSVSAFAATDKVVKEENGTANVEISGVLESNDGVSPAGTISVSVPTALNFKVNKDGQLTGSTIKITNNSTNAVNIAASRFEDKTPTSKIIVKEPSSVNGVGITRDKVVLRIRGNSDKTAYLKTVEPGNNETGIINGNGDNQPDGMIISTIDSNGEDTLILSGFAGTTQLDGEEGKKGLTDEFTLTLKITKA